MSSQKDHLKDLALNAVNPESSIPLYHQVAQDLRRLIMSGELAPYDTLPPEIELGKMYGVGRHTMRMAMRRLVDEKLILRRAGSGTFVNPQQDRTKFYLDRSFTYQITSMGMKASSQILHSGTGIVDENHPQMLQSYIGKPYYLLERLRFGDDQPVVLQKTTILTELCPDIHQIDFMRQSLYATLATEYQLYITQIIHTVNAALADQQQAELLQIAQGIPLLMVKTSAYLKNGELIEFTVSHYRADRYEYSTTHIAG